jgi:hypothetical protein
LNYACFIQRITICWTFPHLGASPLTRFIEIASFSDIQLLHDFVDVRPEHKVSNRMVRAFRKQATVDKIVCFLQETFFLLVDEAVRLQEQLHLPFSYVPLSCTSKTLLTARDSPDKVEEVRSRGMG